MGMVCSPRPVPLGADESYCPDLVDTSAQEPAGLLEVTASHSEEDQAAHKGRWVVTVGWGIVQGGRRDFLVIDLSGD